MRQDKNGYIVVETIGSFIMFVLLVISILSLVNIVTLQARLHYALTQSAQTLALYSYVLTLTETADPLGDMLGETKNPRILAADFQDVITAIIRGRENLSPANTGRFGTAAYHSAAAWIEDSPETMRLLLDYGLDEAINSTTEALIIRPLTGRYLANGAMNGDEYLKSVNVIGGLEGLSFCGFDSGGDPSVLIDQNGDIKLVVRYQIDYMFGALPLPFAPKLSITQAVKTKVWLGGRGEGYLK